MNTLLDTTGAFLYFICNLIILPLLVAFHCIIGAIIIYKQAKAFVVRMKKYHAGRPVLRFPVLADLGFRKLIHETLHKRPVS